MSKHQKKEDLRITKTKIKLSNALIELLKNQSIDTISISNLCDASNISRATFYNNFNSIYDVLNCYLTGLKKQLDDAYAKEKKTTSMTLRNSFDFIIRLAVNHLVTNKNNIKAVLKNNTNSNFHNTIATFFTSSIKEVLMAHEIEMAVLGISISSLASFLSGGISMLLISFIYDDTNKNKDEFVDECSRIIANIFRLNEVRY